MYVGVFFPQHVEQGPMSTFALLFNDPFGLLACMALR